MLPTLPEKYYLEHAHELFGFVENQCAHLLEVEHQTYLHGFKLLDQDAQCLLVRVLTRKPRYLLHSSLCYTEITDLDSAIQSLSEQAYVSPVSARDWENFALVLTKQQLIACLRNLPCKIKSSSPKAELLAICLQNLSGHEHALQSVFEDFLVRRQQKVVDYILFLFFGDLRNRFQKFAMRDLGVLKTRRKQHKQVARFSNKQEALSAFSFQSLRRDYLTRPQELREQVADYLLSTDAVGTAAQETKNSLIVKVGGDIAERASDRAIQLWRCSEGPEATERWVRETYKNGDREALRQELDTMRNQELAAPKKIFIEDFYARKYLGKRTSVFTDMLREPARTLQVDEVYINDVEEGVLNHYHQHNAQAWFVENRHWRVMFALTFWDLLFGKTCLQVNEFDRVPLPLRDGSFFHSNEAAIESCLRKLDSPAPAKAHFTKLATQHYGYPTGIFRWRANLLDSINACLEHSPPGAIANVLRRMAKDYSHTHDGYPDLMVVEEGQLRFEEVKAPGDVLRPNQLVSINRLRQAGFNVDVSQVEWATDPNQCYAVVDIETTGGRRGLHSITEIAVVRIRNGGIISEWSTLVNPQRPIPANITRLTSITNQMVAGAPVFQEISDQLEQQLDDAIFVAHNVGFDYGFIKAAYEQLNRPFRKPKFCTVRNSRKAFPGLKSYSLGNLTAHFDIDLHNAHRALSDARATAQLLLLIQEHRAAA